MPAAPATPPDNPARARLRNEGPLQSEAACGRLRRAPVPAGATPLRRAVPQCRAVAEPPFRGSAGCPSAPGFRAIEEWVTAAPAAAWPEICLRRRAESD